jgi:hypothetical protein
MPVKTPPTTAVDITPVVPSRPAGTSPAQLDVPQRGRSKVVRDSVIRFLLWSVAVLALVAAGTLLLSTPLAERVSVREATTRSVAYA